MERCGADVSSNANVRLLKWCATKMKVQAPIHSYILHK